MQRFRIDYPFICTLFVGLLIFSQPSLANAVDGVGIYEKTLEWQADIGTLTSIAWSPNGQWIAFTSVRGILQIRNANDGSILHTLQVDTELKSLWSLDWNIDNRRIVTGGHDRTVRLWDAMEGRELCVLTGHGRTLSPGVGLRDGISTVQWSPDGTVIASGGFDGTIRLWQTPSPMECNLAPPLIIQTSHPWGVGTIDWGNSNERLISVGIIDTIPFWDTEIGTVTQEIQCPFTPSSPYDSCRFVYADWSSDGRYIIASGDTAHENFTRIWDMETDVSRDIVSSCAVGAQWMPVSIALFTWCESEIQIWDANSFEVIGGTQNATDGWAPDSGTCSACFAVSPDEQRLALAYFTDYANATYAEANMVFEIWDITD